jgi:hypothetical protein
MNTTNDNPKYDDDDDYSRLVVLLLLAILISYGSIFWMLAHQK